MSSQSEYEVWDEVSQRWTSYEDSCYTFKGGFPDPMYANEKVLLITIKNRHTKQFITFGSGPYENKREDVRYIHCVSEQHLLKEFIIWWQQNYPDAVTGWNSSLFDITYLYNRMCKVLGDTLANKISPWGQVRQADVDLGSRKAVKTHIAGIASLDYLDLYKKFGTYSAKESYTLDFIAGEELGSKKLENPTGTDGFKAFYSGEFDVNEDPVHGCHEIEKKGRQRTLMKEELKRRGLM